MEGAQRVNEEAGLTGWVLAAIGTVVSTLAGLVAMFYRAQITDYKTNEARLEAKVAELESRADKCEDDREDLRIKHAVLANKHETLVLRVNDLEARKANRESVDRREPPTA